MSLSVSVLQITLLTQSLNLAVKIEQQAHLTYWNQQLAKRPHHLTIVLPCLLLNLPQLLLLLEVAEVKASRRDWEVEPQRVPPLVLPLESEGKRRLLTWLHSPGETALHKEELFLSRAVLHVKVLALNQIRRGNPHLN